MSPVSLPTAVELLLREVTEIWSGVIYMYMAMQIINTPKNDCSYNNNDMFTVSHFTLISS